MPHYGRQANQGHAIRYAAMRARIWILQDNSMDSSTRTEHETTVTRLDNIQEIVSTIDSNL